MLMGTTQGFLCVFSGNFKSGDADRFFPGIVVVLAASPRLLDIRGVVVVQVSKGMNCCDLHCVFMHFVQI